MPAVGDVSPSAGAGTDQHNKWVEIERRLFESMRKASIARLRPERAAKYNVSLFEQEVTLGLLYPPDAGEHTHVFGRTVNGLRVVSTKASTYVDLQGRRGDVMVDPVKEVGLNLEKTINLQKNPYSHHAPR
jgi:hypothetical protein